MRQLPTDEQVRTVMNEVLAHSGETGRRATVTAVEQQLGVTHATFYRNYPELIEWFKQQTTARRQARSATAPGTVGGSEETLARLRRENEDLRRLVKIYAESIRQLTVDNVALRSAVSGYRTLSHTAPEGSRSKSIPDAGASCPAAPAG